jgi:hypothetical protein
MSKRHALAALAALLAASLAGCIVTPAYTVAPGTPIADESAGMQATEPPPPLPDYDQPPAPEPDYIWTPGVWQWGVSGYYWVPGTWVAPPSVGLLWTPGYWAAAGGVYAFHPGHWGTHVGYYGGVNYGHGYGGAGYTGGRWNGGHFQYNTAVSNVDTKTVHNTYMDNNVARNAGATNNVRESYAGAAGNPARQPNRAESTAAGEPHYAMTAPQTQHHAGAATMPMQNAARNLGRPPVAATPRPSAFTHPQATAAKASGPAYHPSAGERR